MTKHNEAVFRVAVVGGDGREFECAIPDVAVARFPSRRDGGARGVRSVERVIKNGTVELVVLLVKWLGHSDFSAIKRLCGVHAVRCLSLSGGKSALCELVRSEVASGGAVHR